LLRDSSFTLPASGTKIHAIILLLKKSTGKHQAIMEGKIFLVTGASSGMGRDTAYLLAEKGVKGLTLVARRQDVLDNVAADLAKLYPNVTTLTVGADVTSDSDNKRAVEETVAKFGGIHGAFVNAGAYRGGVSLVDISDDDIDTLIDT
jgi:NADP-dependent 3-hydroxy acid dehydrogenase YdfG